MPKNTFDDKSSLVQVMVKLLLHLLGDIELKWYPPHVFQIAQEIYDGADVEHLVENIPELQGLEETELNKK